MGVSLNTFKKAINKLGNYVSSNFLRNDSLISNDESIIINSNGDNKVNISVDATMLMKKDEYVSEENNQYVKKADKAKIVEPLIGAGPNTFLGIDKDGNYGAVTLPFSEDTKQSGIYQLTLTNPPMNSPQIIKSNIDLTDCRIFAQAYKMVAGTQNIIAILKEVNYDNKYDFLYDENNVMFNENNACIKTNFIYTSTKVGNLYESEEIDKSKFLEKIAVSLK